MIPTDKGDKPATTTSLETLATRLAEGHRTVFDFVELSKGKTEVAISLQKLEPEQPKAPLRAESLARGHAFLEAKTFAAYLARFGTDGAIVVWANPEAESMWASLDEDAATGREILSCKPQIHPLAKPWLDQVARGPVSLADFRHFIVAHSRGVVAPKGRELALKMQQLRASVGVELHDGRGKDALNGLTVKTKIDGHDGKEFVALPEELVVKVPLYVDAEPIEIHLDLVVEADARGNVTVQIAATGIHEARVLAFDSMVKGIREALAAKKATVTYGEPAERPWSYLKGAKSS